MQRMLTNDDMHAMFRTAVRNKWMGPLVVSGLSVTINQLEKSEIAMNFKLSSLSVY